MQLDNDLLFGNQAPPVESANNQKFFGDDMMRIDDNSMVLSAVDQRRGTARGGDEIFMGGDILAGGGLHDETARNLIDTVGGGISPLLKKEDDRQELDSMWPS